MSQSQEGNPARGEVQEKFLARVEARYGKRMRQGCAKRLPESDEFSPLTVLKLAEEEVYRDQIEAAAAMDVRFFDSDGDL